MQLILKIPSGIANSVTRNQTIPSGTVWSGSTLFAYAILLETLMYEILEYLLYLYNNQTLLFCKQGDLFVVYFTTLQLVLMPRGGGRTSLHTSP